MQPPLAARIDQPVAHQRLEHVEPIGAFAVTPQTRAPEQVKVHPLPHFQPQPASAPLPRSTHRQCVQPYRHHRAVQLRRCTVFRKQRHGARCTSPVLQDLNASAPRLALRVVDLAQIENMSLYYSAAARALALDDAPVAVQLAVFLADFGTQKHAGEFLRNRCLLQRPRSALHALLPVRQRSALPRSRTCRKQAAPKARKISKPSGQLTKSG
jgi:hypothetical protein